VALGTKNIRLDARQVAEGGKRESEEGARRLVCQHVLDKE